MSGGFTPALRVISDGVNPESSVLASEHGMVKRVGITLDSTAVPADSDGNKVVTVGTIVVFNETTGKYAPYVSPTGEDDPEGLDDRAGIIVDASVNLRHGDVITGLLLHGSVLEARLTNLDDHAREALSSRIIFQ